ncbi:hypothetical protein AsAng_0054280 [Aureispira anguillae]|uniref:Uncharacterized protein n=1 Tax=Aureispira anguillae TaxID=2864201 RepID=A0A915YKJ3_9BACT|nr:hypothetical protein AsAng_0054280 [Aureispira anguillae]
MGKYTMYLRLFYRFLKGSVFLNSQKNELDLIDY